MIRSFAVLIILLFSNCASSFGPSSSIGRLAQPASSIQWKKGKLAILLATGSDDISGPNPPPSEESNISNSGGQEERKTKLTSARIGGRRKRADKTTEVPTEADNKGNFLSKFRTPALIVLLLLLVRGFFSGGEPSTYYYSYSSTVYETRTYDSGGEVKTSRSESRSFKSNIPGMEEGPLYYDDY